MNSTTPVSDTSQVIVETRNALGLITLSRERALNALTEEMRVTMIEALPGFIRNPEIYAMVLRSDSPKAFCAGVDVREMTELGQKDRKAARESFAREYGLNWRLECFAKPTVSLIDGIVMGSGVGISLYGTHRVAGPNYKFAMPETAIGLFPDVGTAHVLSRLPHEIGLYLGLTGRTIDRRDAFALGLATHLLPNSAFQTVMDGLADAEPVDALLRDLAESDAPSALMEKSQTIAACFSAPTVTELMQRLASVPGKDRDWAHEIRDDLAGKAPLSLAITMRHLHRAKDWDLRQTLMMDYRLACRFLDDHDFYEGVRAMLIDRDKAPKWCPATPDEVNEATIERYFAALGREELNLPAREELQELRS